VSAPPRQLESDGRSDDPRTDNRDAFSAGHYPMIRERHIA
jgi:hypothetical protein